MWKEKIALPILDQHLNLYKPQASIFYFHLLYVFVIMMFITPNSSGSTLREPKRERERYLLHWTELGQFIPSLSSYVIHFWLEGKLMNKSKRRIKGRRGSFS